MEAARLPRGPKSGATLVEGLEIARKIMGQPAIAPHVTKEIRPGPKCATRGDLEAHVRAAAGPMFHPVGTARMGCPQDPDVVVDPHLRVLGVERLWVADASVMPTIPAGNTNATALMIGDKGADHILRALSEMGI